MDTSCRQFAHPRLARSDTIVTRRATFQVALLNIGMPRPCAVVGYVGFYARRAFALCGCLGLVPWYFTFASGGRRIAASVSDHGTRPWHHNTKRVPRLCR